MEIAWTGSSFIIVREGYIARAQAELDALQSARTVGDLRVGGFEEVIAAVITEGDLEAAGLDPDLINDPASITDDLTVDPALVWDVAMERELLFSPHQEGAAETLDLLPSEVADLARVGGASPMNSEDFVDFDERDYPAIVAELQERGFVVRDVGLL